MLRSRTNVTVRAGVEIGRGAAVEPGTVVAQNVPADAIVTGSPATIVAYVDRGSRVIARTRVEDLRGPGYHRSVARFTARLLLAALALLVAAPSALASVSVGTNAAAPSLQVDAKGNALVSYTTGGAKRTVLVPATGSVIYGGKLSGPDVSKPGSAAALPFAKVVRKGPGGWTYALQTWPSRSGPVELRFSRWQGSPTKLTLTATQEHLGIALTGTVTYAGKPIPQVSRAPGGVTIREYVYLDQQVGGKWQILGGVTLKTDGSYRRMVYSGQQAGSLFRASVAGPNIGSVYAPDVFVQIPPP